MRKSKYKITIEPSRSGLFWRWVLKSPNSIPIAESMVDRGYSSPAAAKRAAGNAVLAMVTRPVIIEVRHAKNG